MLLLLFATALKLRVELRLRLALIVLVVETLRKMMSGGCSVRPLQLPPGWASTQARPAAGFRLQMPPQTQQSWLGAH
jgi:hypothetical protein